MKLYPEIPVGMPVAEPVSAKPMTVVGVDEAFPPGLSAALSSTAKAFPSRIVVVDNSGSMNMTDGSLFVPGGGGYRKVASTRWQELGVMVTSNGALTQALSTRTDYHLLTPIQGLPHEHQYLSLNCGGDARVKRCGEECNLRTLHEVMAGHPAMGTPLTEAVMTIVNTVTPAAAELRARGERVMIVLATDGLPNHPPSFLDWMRKLQHLPVHVIVRLCTSDDSIVSYWSDLDKSLEIKLDVLDDWGGEATEIYKVNSWFTYGRPLHLAREFGMLHPLFDQLDERSMTPAQIKQFLELLLGIGLPDPALDQQAFLGAVGAALPDLGLVFDPVMKRMREWVDLDLLDFTLTAAFHGDGVALCRLLGKCVRGCLA